MNYEDLMTYLDLEDPSELEYFETMADLIESEEYIEQEALFELFYNANKNKVSMLIDEYFEEISNGLPDDSDGIYSLLDQMRLCLIGLAENGIDESDIRLFTDEFSRFREWYVYESQVEVIPDEGPSGFQCVRDAIATARAEKVGGCEYRYDFEQALSYEIDSYTMSIAELAAFEEDDE